MPLPYLSQDPSPSDAKYPPSSDSDNSGAQTYQTQNLLPHPKTTSPTWTCCHRKDRNSWSLNTPPQYLPHLLLRTPQIHLPAPSPPELNIYAGNWIATSDPHLNQGTTSPITMYNNGPWTPHYLPTSTHYSGYQNSFVLSQSSPASNSPPYNPNYVPIPLLPSVITGIGRTEATSWKKYQGLS